jgi:hypothetical protein
MRDSEHQSIILVTIDRKVIERALQLKDLKYSKSNFSHVEPLFCIIGSYIFDICNDCGIPLHICPYKMRAFVGMVSDFVGKDVPGDFLQVGLDHQVPVDSVTYRCLTTSAPFHCSFRYSQTNRR